MEEGYVTLGTEILTYTNTMWRFQIKYANCQHTRITINYLKNMCLCAVEVLRCVMLPTIFAT